MPLEKLRSRQNQELRASNIVLLKGEIVWHIYLLSLVMAPVIAEQ